ncbi:hypothetical protein OZX74_01640 [Bifidobacterium sp. ESL0798]|uniref:hypothetical protein n=1 Tax=Bifidobacterium sp. ESL0798 TaxID=2983235 RepID=UPI0023F7605B|nr:hypothetical protein [Bifidobacterium sp. ESL0798]WEV74287.1 hypothetical protein OZX74_01640 [Bifidobacterium sp. ESL0798]
MILLEVLALGQLAAITTTGGNKYFKQFSAPGIFYFDTAEELSTAITQIQHLSPKERKEVSDQNTALYTSNFTYSTFAQKYCSLMDSLR